MKAGAMVALLIAAILALAVVPSAHAGRDLLGDSSSDKGNKVSTAGAISGAHAYGYGTYANRTYTGTNNTVVAKPGLAYSQSGSTAESAGYRHSMATVDGKALAKGDFAKTYTRTTASANYYGGSLRSKTSAGSVSGRKLQGDSSSDKGKNVSIADAEAGVRGGSRTSYGRANSTAVTKPGLAYSKSGSTANNPSYIYPTDAVVEADGKALAKGDFSKTHTDTDVYSGPYGGIASSNSSAGSVSGPKLQGDSSSDKGKNVSIAGAKAGALGVGTLSYAGTNNTVVTKPGLAYSKSGSTAGRGVYYYHTVAKTDGKALAKGDFAKTHTDTEASATYFGAKSSSKSSAVSISG